jgi:hypothetical protein
MPSSPSDSIARPFPKNGLSFAPRPVSTSTVLPPSRSTKLEMSTCSLPSDTCSAWPTHASAGTFGNSPAHGASNDESSNDMISTLPTFMTWGIGPALSRSPPRQPRGSPMYGLRIEATTQARGFAQIRRFAVELSHRL